MKHAAPDSMERSLRNLRFPDEQEDAFRRDFFAKSLGPVRLVCFLTLLLVAAMGLPAIHEPQSVRVRDWAWHYGVQCPSLLLLLLFTFSPRFYKFMQPAMALAALLLGVSVMTMFVLGGQNVSEAQAVAYLHRYVINLILLLVAIYTLCRLRFMAATLVCWTLLALHQWVAMQRFHLDLSSVMTYDVPLFAANLLGMVANYTMEQHIRRDFLLSQLLQAEREKSDRLLVNILPTSIAERLKHEPGIIADHFDEVSILFADIVDFTPLSARLAPEALITLLNTIFSAFDALAEQYGLEKIKTVGDSYLVVGGLPTPKADHAEAIADLALALQQEAARLSEELGQPLRLQIGINTGPVVAGVLGTRKFIYDLWGNSVNVASRMESHGICGAIQVTEATYARLEAKYCFEDRGTIKIKGCAPMRTYLLTGRRASP